jgi:hypothetical protein
MAQPIPIPAFAPVERSELPLGGPLGGTVAVDEEISDPAVLVAELVAMIEGLEEVVFDDGLARELFVGAEVEIVAPEEPSVRTSVFSRT